MMTEIVITISMTIDNMPITLFCFFASFVIGFAFLYVVCTHAHAHAPNNKNYARHARAYMRELEEITLDAE